MRVKDRGILAAVYLEGLLRKGKIFSLAFFARNGERDKVAILGENKPEIFWAIGAQRARYASYI